MTSICSFNLSFVVYNSIFHQLDDFDFTFIVLRSCFRGGCGGCASRIGSEPASGTSVTFESRISVQRVSGKTDEVHLVAVLVVTFVDYVVTIRDRIRIRAVISTHYVRYSVFPLCQ